MSGRTIYSHHHFMFPFRWDVLPAGFGLSDIKENLSFDKRTDISKIPDTFGKWERKPYELSDAAGSILAENYNEFTYFHEFAQKAIFDFNYPWKKEQNIVKYLEYGLDKSGAAGNYYYIRFLEKEGTVEKTYKLNVDGITLHFFCTGVGVLTFNLSNLEAEQAGEDAILKINEYGRRMYPSFLGVRDGLASPKKSFLADNIKLSLSETENWEEDFSFYDQVQYDLKPYEPYRLPAYIRHLFSPLFIFRLDGEKLQQDSILITKVTDDRMFFHSWYGNDKIAGEISQCINQEESLDNEWLYAYIFGDKEVNSSIANNMLRKKHFEAHTYNRWAGCGTVYGMSRDSFVCLTNTSDFSKSNVRQHMQSVYYSLSVICIAQHTSILKFKMEVANLSDLAKGENKQLIFNIKEIYKNYIEFINKLYFREVSSQIQGIELYNQMQKLMNLESEIKDLDEEIGELHQYVSLLQDEQRNEEASKLGRLATIILPFTVVFGVMGINSFTQENFEFSNRFDDRAIAWIAIGIAISLLISLVFYFTVMNKKGK